MSLNNDVDWSDIYVDLSVSIIVNLTKVRPIFTLSHRESDNSPSLLVFNQSTVSTAKRLASLFWYLIASTIDTLRNTINIYEIACIWISKYNVHACMIQTNADFIISKTYCVCFLLTLNCENTAACNVLELISVRVVLCTICLTRYFVP